MFCKKAVSGFQAAASRQQSTALTLGDQKLHMFPSISALKSEIDNFSLPSPQLLILNYQQPASMSCSFPPRKQIRSQNIN